MVELTHEQAMRIRDRYQRRGEGGAGISSLAAEYGVSNATVSRIVKGTHALTEGMPPLPVRGNSFQRRETAIGVTPLAGQTGATPRQAKAIIASRAGSLGSHKARLRLACPTCEARPNDPCWSRRGAYPVKLKGLHPERRVKTGSEETQS